jgi:hypothetical protein
MTQVPNGKADTATTDSTTKESPNGHPWQFSLSQMFAATTGVAIMFGLAAWGGWVQTDAAAYLSIAVLLGVFLPTTRWSLLGTCAILGVYWLAIIVSTFLYGPEIVSPTSIGIVFLLLTISSGLLRVHAHASAWSLAISLILFEVVTGAMVVYECGCPTLFQALAPGKRALVFLYLCSNSPPLADHLLVAGPWLAGIGLGTIYVRWRKSGNRPKEPLIDPRCCE